jgi:hypothetical protein
MSRQPIWAVSAWGSFVCMLFAINSLVHGEVAASLLMAVGAAVLGGWAFWLARRHH